MQEIRGITRTSRRFKILFIILAVITPLFPLGIWGGFNYLPELIRQKMFGEAGAGAVRDISLAGRGIGFAAGLFSAAIASYGFYILVRLFSLYEMGKIFLAENVVLYRRLGFVIIISMATGVIARSVTTIALTVDNPPGRRMITFGLSSSDFMSLVIGLLVLLIARIMDRARELREDQDLTV